MISSVWEKGESPDFNSLEWLKHLKIERIFEITKEDLFLPKKKLVAKVTNLFPSL